MSKSIKKYISQNLDIILKILTFYVLGIALGIVLYLITDDGKEYVNIVIDTFNNFGNDNFEGLNIISNGIKNNLCYIALLYFSAFTIICPIILLVILFVMAIIKGIYICTLLYIFGFLKGVVLVLVTVILPLLFSVSGYIILCINIISIYNKIKDRENLKMSDIIFHIYYLIIALSFISFSIVVEQLTSSMVVSFYTNILQC